jgi:hypothetical protein
MFAEEQGIPSRQMQSELKYKEIWLSPFFLFSIPENLESEEREGQVGIWGGGKEIKLEV